MGKTEKMIDEYQWVFQIQVLENLGTKYVEIGE